MEVGLEEKIEKKIVERALLNGGVVEKRGNNRKNRGTDRQTNTERVRERGKKRRRTGRVPREKNLFRRVAHVIAFIT